MDVVSMMLTVDPILIGAIVGSLVLTAWGLHSLAWLAERMFPGLRTPKKDDHRERQ